MDNQHKSIRGYRDLSAAEIALMNALKRHEASLTRTLNDTGHTFRDIIHSETAAGKLDQYERKHKFAVYDDLMGKAKDQFMVGFMLAIRAVAQPQPLQEEKEAHIPWESVESGLGFRSDIHPDELVLALTWGGEIKQTTVSSLSNCGDDTPGELEYRYFCPVSKLPKPAEV